MTRIVEECGLCGNPDLQPVLSLGVSPPTCVMVPVGRTLPEDYHTLELLRCPDCTLVQLSVIVDPETVFPPDYPYSSGNSVALHENFEDLARQASSWVHGLEPTDLVVDIGANDGTLLSKFHCRTVGVEPTGQAQKINGPTYEEFFTAELAGRILAEHGPAKVITACNVLAHVEDVHDVMEGINVLSADDGVLIVENHDLASVVDGRQWDTIYHEHLRFYDPYSFNWLLVHHGFRASGCEHVRTHGGSFRMLASRTESAPWPRQRAYDFDGLAQDAERAREAIRSVVGGLPGIGATARATTIINFCDLDHEDVPYVCEVAGSDKIGHYIPGTRIPVVDEGRLFEEQPPRAMLFSWHLADVIVPKLRERGYRGEILVPLPTLRNV
jgi:hypothetical protein